jgi:hypothetical protein
MHVRRWLLMAQHAHKFGKTELATIEASGRDRALDRKRMRCNVLLQL